VLRDHGDDDSLLEEELVHIMERSLETGEQDQPGKRRNNTPLDQRSRSKTPSLSGRSKALSSSHYRSTHDEVCHGHYRQRQRVTSGATAREGRTVPSMMAEPEIESRSIKDKIRAFNQQRSPDQSTKSWHQRTLSVSSAAVVSGEKKSASAHCRVPEGIHAIRRYKGRSEEEEKKEDSILHNHEHFSPKGKVDSSVQILRSKLERIAGYQQSKVDRRIEEDKDDDYSVPSLREKYEQKIAEQNNPDNDDDGSVRSLRERFENPTKPKSDHVNFLRAKFESKGPAKKRISQMATLKKRNPKDDAIPPKVVTRKSVPEPQIALSEPPKTICLTVNDASYSSDKPPAFVDETVIAECAVSLSPFTTDSDKSVAPFDTDDATAILGEYRARGTIREADHGESTKPWTSDEKKTSNGSNHHDRTVQKAESPKPPLTQPHVARNTNPHVESSDESNRGVSRALATPLDSGRGAGVSQGTGKETPRLSPLVFHPMHSRLNQWASRRQIEMHAALASSQGREDSQEQLMAGDGIEQKGSYDMTPVDEAQVKPTLPFENATNGTSTNSEALRVTERRGGQTRNNIFRPENKDDSQSEDDEQNMVPGSHWTTKTAGIDDGKMPQKDDPRGASTDSEYSEAVTLDASIAEVSLLTNPSPIRSKDSKEGDRQSDTSSSAVEKKSEASSSQLSEAAAPLISGSMHIRSDELSNDVKSGAVSASSEAVEFNPTYDGRDEENQKMRGLTLGNSAMASADKGHQGHWDQKEFQSPFPAKSDRFDMSLKDVSDNPFADSNWPDFGDENGWAGSYNAIGAGPQHDVERTQTTSSGKLERGLNPRVEMKLSNHAAYPIEHEGGGEIQQEILSNGSHYLESQTHPVGTPHCTGLTRLDMKSPPEIRSIASRSENRLAAGSPTRAANIILTATPTRHDSRTPTRERESSRPSTPDSHSRRSQVAPFENLTEAVLPSTLKSPYLPRTSDYEPRAGYGSSRTELLSRTQGSPKAKVSPAPPVIKLAAVPPLPSPFDPDYEAIMESRHQMLLSRQRALQHRREIRERPQTPPQSSIFARTHPDQMPVPSRNPVPDPQSAILVRKAVPVPVVRATRAPEVFGRGSDRALDPFVFVGEETFETPTRSSRLPREPEGSRWPPPDSQKTENAHDDGSRWPPVDSQKTENLWKTSQNQKVHSPSFCSNIKSSFGMANESREMTQSQAVIARITAVRAARMRRSLTYGERDPTGLSYRQTQAMSQTSAVKNPSSLDTSAEESVSNLVPGYRFYTHDDLKEQEPDQTDDFSISNNSNAQDYAAALAVD
jgi:hypothetical protein